MSAGRDADAGSRQRWTRFLRLAVTGLVAGAVAGFVAALVRPRSWIEYVEPRAASRP